MAGGACQNQGRGGGAWHTQRYWRARQLWKAWLRHFVGGCAREVFVHAGQRRVAGRVVVGAG